MKITISYSICPNPLHGEVDYYASTTIIGHEGPIETGPWSTQKKAKNELIGIAKEYVRALAGPMEEIVEI